MVVTSKVYSSTLFTSSGLPSWRWMALWENSWPPSSRYSRVHSAWSPFSQFQSMRTGSKLRQMQKVSEPSTTKVLERPPQRRPRITSPQSVSTRLILSTSTCKMKKWLILPSTRSLPTIGSSGLRLTIQKTPSSTTPLILWDTRISLTRS